VPSRFELENKGFADLKLKRSERHDSMLGYQIRQMALQFLLFLVDFWITR